MKMSGRWVPLLRNLLLLFSGKKKYPEEGGNKFLQNVGTYLSNCMLSQPKSL
jgi:hypothetical protein